MAHKVEIIEAYRNYSAPTWVRPTVDALLNGIPAKYLSGIKTVVLTDAGGLNHQRRRAKTLSRKKKVKISQCRGLYHREWHGEPAWIELFIDNTVGTPSRLYWLRIVRDLFVGSVLAHEVGHHVHATMVPEYKEREDVADKWSSRLMVPYLMRRHWCLVPLLFVTVTAQKWIHKVLGKQRRKRNSTGAG